MSFASPVSLYFRHHGRDIDGACGQLAVKVVASESGSVTANSCRAGGGSNGGGDIEDLVAKSNRGWSRGTSGGTESKRRLSRKDPYSSDAVVKARKGNVVVRESTGWSRRGRVALAGMVLGLGVVVAVAVARARRRG